MSLPLLFLPQWYSHLQHVTSLTAMRQQQQQALLLKEQQTREQLMPLWQTAQHIHTTMRSLISQPTGICTRIRQRLIRIFLTTSQRASMSSITMTQWTATRWFLLWQWAILRTLQLIMSDSSDLRRVMLTEHGRLLFVTTFAGRTELLSQLRIS